MRPMPVVVRTRAYDELFYQTMMSGYTPLSHSVCLRRLSSSYDCR
jgi:hypothetical protein